MAWNEPGGNSNNQDPWGGRRGGDKKGPPDIDEAFRKLQEGLGGIFGNGNKGSNGSRSGNGGGLGVVFIALAVIAAAWLYNAIYVVDAQEQAVILRFGKYHETVGDGLNIYFPPMDRKYQENVTRERTYSKVGQMLTKDENIVEVPLTVQYKINDLKNFVLNVDNPEVSLQHATESALRFVAGSTSMDSVITAGREVMSEQVRERLQQTLDSYGAGIVVTQVNIQRATAPAEVKDAFDDVIRAREDEQREKNLADSYANGVIPEARGQVQRMLEDANGYRDEVVSRAQGEADRFTKLLTEYRRAPEVTRERLYLETMQDVYSSTSKVLVSGKEGQSNLLYLPLDKMMENRQNVAPMTSTGIPATLENRARPTEPTAADLRTREGR